MKKARLGGNPGLTSNQFCTSHSNAISAFRDAMADAGMVVTGDIIADGALHRCHVEGDKRGTKNGAYVLHTDGVASGWFSNFRGVNQTWSLSGQREPVTPELRQKIEEAKRQREEERARCHQVAATSASSIWRNSKPAPADHPYLTRKRIKPHGLKVRAYGPLIVPIYNIGGALVNVQFIANDGGKMFLSGGQKRGCFSAIGKFDPGCKVLIAEGWATAASIHEDTGQFTVVALDAGNLTPVALAWRTKSPTSEIILMGDNDLSGVGQKAAEAAARAVGGKFLIPPNPGQDWNDFISLGAKP